MKFSAVTRIEHGTNSSRLLRRLGFIPAVICAKNSKSIHIKLNHNEIYHALKKDEFHKSVLEMQLTDCNIYERVLLRSVQWHPYKKQILHIDFQRVD